MDKEKNYIVSDTYILVSTLSLIVGVLFVTFRSNISMGWIGLFIALTGLIGLVLSLIRIYAS